MLAEGSHTALCVVPSISFFRGKGHLQMGLFFCQRPFQGESLRTLLVISHLVSTSLPLHTPPSGSAPPAWVDSVLIKQRESVQLGTIASDSHQKAPLILLSAHFKRDSIALAFCYLACVSTCYYLCPSTIVFILANRLYGFQ